MINLATMIFENNYIAKKYLNGSKSDFHLCLFLLPVFHERDIIKKQKNAMRFSPEGMQGGPS